MSDKTPKARPSPAPATPPAGPVRLRALDNLPRTMLGETDTAARIERGDVFDAPAHLVARLTQNGYAEEA